MPVNITTITGTCRKFENFDLAFLWLRCRKDHLKYMFTCPDDFNRFTERAIEIMWPRFQEWSMFRWKEDRVGDFAKFRQLHRESQNKYLWQMVNRIADPVHVRPQFNMSKDGVEIDLELCDRLLGLTEWDMIDVKAPELPSRMRKPAHQLRSLVRALLLNDQVYTSETELEIIMTTSEMSRALKTRQEAWRIFRYYRTVLEKLGVLRET